MRGGHRECEAMLEAGRKIRPLSDVVRARAMARARSSLAGGIQPTPLVAPTRPAQSYRMRIAAIAAAAVLAGAAGAVAAMRGGMLNKMFSPPPPPSVPEQPIAPRAPIPAHAAAVAAPPSAPPAEAPRPTRHANGGPQDSYAAELALLHRAHAAYASRDYAETVRLVSEHARRFPSGRLAEEREALRVRSLTRAGHHDEARRAAEEFSAHFPRSVLLSRLRQTAAK